MKKFKELQESFFKNLKKMLHLSSGKTDNEIDEILIGQADSEEEKQVIRDICQEVDEEHLLMDNLVNSNKEPGEWFEIFISETTKELYPNATGEDIEMVLKTVEDGMEKEIETDADRLDEELSATLFLKENYNQKEIEEGEYNG